MTKRTAALQAGRGASQFAGSSTPNVRCNQPPSSSRSSASARFARQLPSSAASGSLRLLARSARSSLSRSSDWEHAAHCARWADRCSCSAGSSSPPVAWSVSSGCHSAQGSFAPLTFALELESKSRISLSSRLPNCVQARSQFPRGPEQRILHRLFRSAQQVADRAKSQALVVLHLKNHALARRKALHGLLDVLAQLVAEQLLFGIRSSAWFRLAIEKVARPALGFLRDRRLFLAVAGAAAQMIESDVGHDPVEPGVKAALEPE